MKQVPFKPEIRSLSSGLGLVEKRRKYAETAALPKTTNDSSRLYRAQPDGLAPRDQSNRNQSKSAVASKRPRTWFLLALLDTSIVVICGLVISFFLEQTQSVQEIVGPELPWMQVLLPGLMGLLGLYFLIFFLLGIPTPAEWFSRRAWIKLRKKASRSLTRS